LTAEQKLAFKEMQTKAVTTFAGGQVTAANTAVMLSKLLQICCGVVYTETDSICLDAKFRYNLLTELIDEIGGKVIIFVPLKGVQYWLRDSLIKDGYDLALVNGDVKGKERDQIFNDFQHTDKPTILLAHPKVAAHGLTLTAAKDIIWYAPIYSLEQYEQANARIRRISTEGKTTVWHILATKFEAELYRRLRQKQNVLAAFLDLVNGVNSDDDY
jgi:SNF2 family DNA or RNA helicase